MTRTVALQLREEWDYMLSHQAYSISRTWVSSSLLRPFLFFTTCLSTRRQRIQTRDAACIQKCFKILLESINSTGIGFSNTTHGDLYLILLCVLTLIVQCVISKLTTFSQFVDTFVLTDTGNISMILTVSFCNNCYCCTKHP